MERKIDKVSKQSSSLDYIPSSSDSEVLYPLAGNTQLVITTYESSSRSSPVDLTIQGLSRADLNIIVNALIHGEGFSIAGDDDDIATCEAIAEGQLFTPRSNIHVNQMTTGSNGASKSSRQPKPRSTSSNSGERGKRSRISSDDLQEAIDILHVIEPQGIAKSDILEHSGIDERLWIPAMKALIEEGVWRVEGVKRGARYYAII